MVKHAAKEGEPLLTAAERVERAFAKLTAGKEFTPDQQAWLRRIHGHLLANLSIERDDFDNVPVLLDAGGWSKADQVFNGRLPELIGRLNEAIAA